MTQEEFEAIPSESYRDELFYTGPEVYKITWDNIKGE